MSRTHSHRPLRLARKIADRQLDYLIGCTYNATPLVMPDDPSDPLDREAAFRLDHTQFSGAWSGVGEMANRDERSERRRCQRALHVGADGPAGPTIEDMGGWKHRRAARWDYY